MLKVDLKVLGGKHHGKLIPLLTSKFLIGREEDCQLRPTSELVSRHHCVFSVDDYCVRLRDLGSTNGTLVNGQRIRGQVELKAGDKVHIGKLDFELVIRAGVREPQSTVAVPSGGGSHPAQVPLESPTPAPGVAPLEADTAQLSNSETSFELPSQPSQVLADTAPNAGALSSDTTVMYMPQAPAQPYAPQSQSPMMPPAPPLAPMQGYPQPPGYPVPGGYPQMPYPQYGYPYPQMPPQYYQPGMPFQQPMMALPPQYEMPAPEAADDDAGGNVPAPPVKLPPPETTGASPGKPVVGSSGVVQQKPGEAAVKPSDKAAEIIRQMTQRRPTGGGKK